MCVYLDKVSMFVFLDLKGYLVFKLYRKFKLVDLSTQSVTTGFNYITVQNPSVMRAKIYVLWEQDNSTMEICKFWKGKWSQINWYNKWFTKFYFPSVARYVVSNNKKVLIVLWKKNSSKILKQRLRSGNLSLLL